VALHAAATPCDEARQSESSAAELAAGVRPELHPSYTWRAGTVQCACEGCPVSVAGTMRGRVVKPTAEKRSAEVLDGIVAYPDANGVECFAAFGAHQVLRPSW